MNVNLLAAAVEGGTLTIDPMQHFPGQTDLMSWCQSMGLGTAVLLMIMGVVYLLYGWSSYRILITLNAAIVGGYLGAMAGERAGGYAIPGGFVGAVIAAGCAWPLMKWAVAVMGGLCGAMVGASVWLMAGLDGRFAWAGAMTGLVGFGLFSFILFRGSIIAYTSIQGAAMFVVGLLGLGFKWGDVAPALARHMSGRSVMLPIAVLIPTILGLIYQQTHSSGGGGAAPAKPAEKK